VIEIEFICAFQGDFGIEGPRGGVGLPGKTVSNIASSVTHYNQGFLSRLLQIFFISVTDHHIADSDNNK